jgi:hypothetical protein
MSIDRSMRIRSTAQPDTSAKELASIRADGILQPSGARARSTNSSGERRLPRRGCRRGHRSCGCADVATPTRCGRRRKRQRENLNAIEEAQAFRR